jgi:hypothetical protein
MRLKYLLYNGSRMIHMLLAFNCSLNLRQKIYKHTPVAAVRVPSCAELH